jgi:hypothetical protein
MSQRNCPTLYVDRRFGLQISVSRLWLLNLLFGHAISWRYVVWTLYLVVFHVAERDLSDVA